MGEEPHYAAFMLRLWRVGSDDGPAWRISLQCPRTGELRVFTSLQNLFMFLQNVCDDPCNASAAPTGRRR